MTINGLHLLLAFVAVLACIGWTVDYRRRVTAERQRDIAHRIATEKGQRLLAALDERDAARKHADDAQWFANEVARANAQLPSQQRHPAYGNVRVLRSVPE